MEQTTTRRESISFKSILCFTYGVLFGSSFFIFLGLVALTLSGCASLAPNNESEKVHITRDRFCALWETIPYDWKVDWMVDFPDACESDSSSAEDP